MNAQRASLLVIDAHVHMYDCFDHRRFFDAAFSNSSRESAKQGNRLPHIPMLLLAEGRREGTFRRFTEERKKGRDRIGRGRYTISETEEAESLRIGNAAGGSLYLLSGRQVVTSEGLEVLALATSSDIPEGLPLGETVDAAWKKEAPVVLPWGFGKWHGKRGKLLREYLASERSSNVFLGDNGGRPSFLPLPRFPRGESGRPLKVLPGSDPLPLPAEADKVGGFGFTLSGELDPARPAGSLKRILYAPDLDPVPYGAPESIFRFVKNQVGLRIWKHRT